MVRKVRAAIHGLDEAMKQGIEGGGVASRLKVGGLGMYCLPSVLQCMTVRIKCYLPTGPRL